MRISFNDAFDKLLYNSNMTEEERLISVVPSERQLEFQKTEFYAFVHFTVNTFTDKEWGDGSESPVIFNPQKLDANQWVSAVKAAGMKGLILTCKHHDGFCLWPSKFTKHTVAASPYKDGNGDIVREVSLACKAQGIKFGVYLSPWDRNCPLYGQGKAYDDFFVNQLTELLTNYGEIFSVWFDGACGEGPNGKKQYYDWERYYSVIRKLQPKACISVCGPDIRWCGNEAGYTRESEWSVVPERAKDSEIISEKSQQEDNAEFRLRRVDARDRDLGSRELLRGEEKLIWYPAEVNTSIRPGWFYHEYEDDKVRSLEELVKIYMNSVGGNATFLLNIPPTREGLFHQNDVARLKELGDFLRSAFAVNLAEYAEISEQGALEKGVFTITINLEKPEQVKYLVIQEDIRKSQRVEKFSVEIKKDGLFEKVYDGTVIGYKKIVRLCGDSLSAPGVTTDCLRIKINECRKEPVISFVGVY